MKLRFVEVFMQGMLLITDKVFGTARDKHTGMHRSYSTAMLVLLLLFGLYTEWEDGGGIITFPHQIPSWGGIASHRP